MFFGVEELEVRGVLVAEQRLARRRLPDHVVLDQPQAREAGERGAERRVALGQHGRGQGAVGLPDVAELARAVGRAGGRVVVDLVGREAGLPLVLEAAVEALAHALDLVVAEPALDDEEAVAPIGVDLLLGRLHRRRVAVVELDLRAGCRRRRRCGGPTAADLRTRRGGGTRTTPTPAASPRASPRRRPARHRASRTTSSRGCRSIGPSLRAAGSTCGTHRRRRAGRR